MLEAALENTHPPGSLEREFSANGAATIRGLLTPDAVAAVRGWLAGIVDLGRAAPSGFEAEFEPGTDKPRKLRRLYWNDEPFWRGVFAESGVPGIAERLVARPSG